MASVIGTFVPTYQGLSATDFVRSRREARPTASRSTSPHRLPFYRARNAIYHLFRALLETNPGLTVLAPDYNSGNEILAMRAAGANASLLPRATGTCRSIPTRSSGTVARTTRISSTSSTTSAGRSRWRSSSICAAGAACCSSRTARCRCSAKPTGGRSAAFGDWSVFCLYKTLPLAERRAAGAERPAARVARTAARCAMPDRRRCSGATAELLVQRIRGRANGVGAALQVVKRGMGRAAGALDVRRANVGDIGFNLDEVDLAMSRVSRAAARAVRLSRTSGSGASRTIAGSTALLRPDVVQAFPIAARTACARCSSRCSCPTSTPRRAASARAASTRSSSGTTAVNQAGTRWVPTRGSCAVTSRAADSSGPDPAAYRSHRQAGQQPADSGWPS